MTDRRSPRRHEESHARGGAAHHDVVDVAEAASVDIDEKTPAGQAGERRAYAANEFVLRSAGADGFPHGQRDEIAYANGCRERERARAVRGDGVYVERDAHRYHSVKVWRIFEEPPAVRE